MTDYQAVKGVFFCLLAICHGDAGKTGRKPKVIRPVLLAAVAWCFWHVGIPIGKMFGKEDWSAVLPETILKEAKAVSFMLASGALERREKPCYMLRTVRERPFVGD